MFYRFRNGVFVEAETFDEARGKLIEQVLAETEDKARWHVCTCTGLEHRWVVLNEQNNQYRSDD